MLDVVGLKREVVRLSPIEAPATLGGKLAVMSLSGLCLWFLGVWNHPIHLNGYGLLPSLNILYWSGTFLCAASFGIAILRQVTDRRALLLALGSLMATLDLTPLMLEHTARFTYAYVSYGYADYIVRHHALNLQHFIYLNWPLLHIVVAMLVIAGINPLLILMFGPILAQMAYVAIVYRLASLISGRRQVAWAAAGLYVVTSENTAYILPAMAGLLLALTAITLVLSIQRDGEEGKRAWGKTALTVLVAAAIVPTHLLSSIYLVLFLAGVLTLGWSRMTKRAILPAGAAVLALVVWQGYVAVAWTDSTLPGVIHGLFQIGQTASATGNFALGESEAHTRVVDIRLALYVLMALASAAGWLFRVMTSRRFTLDTTVCAVGVCCPFLLAILTSYNGEIISRAFGLATPFMAICAAFLVTSRAGRRAVAAMVLVFVVAYPVYAYGNEMLDYVSPAEITASQYLINHMPPEIHLTNTIQRTIPMGRIGKFYSYPTHPVAVTFAGKPFDRARRFWGVSARQAGMVPTCHKPWYTNSEVRIYVCAIPHRRARSHGRRDYSRLPLQRYS